MNEKVDVPEGIKPHASDYKRGAWTNYTLEELGQWIALFAKRSSHRSNLKKREKDLHDARNYLSMLDSQISHLEDQLYQTLFLYDPQVVGEVALALSGVDSQVEGGDIDYRDSTTARPTDTPDTSEKVDPPGGVDPDKPDLRVSDDMREADKCSAKIPEGMSEADNEKRSVGFV